MLAMVTGLLGSAPAALTAQAMSGMPGMETPMQAGPLGISHARMGSGTTWLPDSSPMHANHAMWGAWTLMFHGSIAAQYDRQGSRRGDEQFGALDWEMVMAMRKVGTGLLHLHGMFSLEPATIGGGGYPLLLQTGETFHGRALHDRQHPHDTFMELAALFEHPVTSGTAASMYAGAVGEPALGPVAYMHRPSAMNDPFAPLSHHWQDATHITFGVVTGALYSRTWKLEGSAFNGREPDENRWNFDFAGRRLDSYAGRLTVNPSAHVSMSTWYGALHSPEALYPDESLRRYGASILHSGRRRGGEWASTMIWGANDDGGHVRSSILAETSLEIGMRNTVFARAERVTKSAADLVIIGVPPATDYRVNGLSLGIVREAITLPGTTVGVGVRGGVNFIPRSLESVYGTKTPAGLDVFVRVRPQRMATTGASHHDMSGSPGAPR
jgi:hypothetical protein